MAETFEQHLKKILAEHGSTIQPIITDITACEKHPRAQVVVANVWAELIVNIVVKDKCKKGEVIAGDHWTYTHAVKITLLHEANLLTDDVAECLRWMNKCRNDAAHDVLFDPSDSVPALLQMDFDLLGLGAVCMLTLGALLGSFTDVCDRDFRIHLPTS